MERQENKGISCKAGTGTVGNRNLEKGQKKEIFNRYSADMDSPLNYKITNLPSENGIAFFDKSEWLSTREAAVYLRKVSNLGVPSINAVHKLVCNGKLRRRKFAGRLYFSRRELEFLIETSNS